MKKEMNSNVYEVETKVKEATKNTINNLVDKAAQDFGVYAKTPVNMGFAINATANGSIGDLQIAVTAEASSSITNGAYRKKQRNRKRRIRKDRQSTPEVQGPVVCNAEVKSIKDISCDTADCNCCIFDPKIEMAKLRTYLNSHSDSDPLNAQKEAEKLMGKLEASFKNSSLDDKLRCDYYNIRHELEMAIDFLKSKRSIIVETTVEGDDVLVDILTSLQRLNKFKELTYTILSEMTYIDGDTSPRPFKKLLIDDFGVDHNIVNDLYNEMHDCIYLDVFTIKASKGAVYITAGNVDGAIETYNSNTSSETSMEFIGRMLAVNLN